MRMNMTDWAEQVKTAKVKKAMPVLSFPAIQLMNIGVKELISGGETQAKGMKMVADRTNALASVSMMDLSIEAEAFGSAINVPDDEVPTVIGSIVNTMEDAEKLQITFNLSTGRIGNYLSAIPGNRPDYRPSCFCGSHRTLFSCRPSAGCDGSND